MFKGGVSVRIAQNVMMCGAMFKWGVSASGWCMDLPVWKRPSALNDVPGDTLDPESYETSE